MRRTGDSGPGVFFWGFSFNVEEVIFICTLRGIDLCHQTNGSPGPVARDIFCIFVVVAELHCLVFFL